MCACAYDYNARSRRGARGGRWGGAAATTWYVDDDGGAGIDFTEIQAAVNVASDGDTIFVHSGMYNETVIVNRSLTLQGENRETTIIDANGGDRGIEITADDCVLSGFTIWKCWDTGIELSSSNENMITNNVIHSMISGSDCDGIKLDESSHNVISNNKIFDCGGEGIETDWSSHNIIINNTVISCGTGIELWNFDRSNITNNTVNSCSSGIQIGYSDYNNITNNTVLLCNPNIKLKYSDHNIVSNNIVYSPHCNGIKLTNSTNNAILNNIIYSIHGSSCGIRLVSSMYNEIYHNDLINNTNHACDDGDTNSWDKGPVIGGNYWSGHVCTGDPSDGSQPYYIDTDSIDYYPFEHPINDVSSVPLPEPIVYVGAQMREHLSTYETHIDHNKDYEFEVDSWRIEVSSIHNLRTDNLTYTITTPMNFTYLYNSEEYTNGTYDDIIFNFTQTGDNYTWVLPMKDRISSEIRLKPTDEAFLQKKPCADMDVSMIDENNHTRLNITIVPTINCGCGLDVRGDHVINVAYPPDFCIWWLGWCSVDFGGDMVKNQSYNFSILLDNPGSVEFHYDVGDDEWGFCYSNNFTRPVTELGSIEVSSAVPVGWEYDVPYPEYRQYIEIDLTPIPDLTLSQPDITFSNPNPVPSEEVTIDAAIHNIGTADASNVIVQFFDNEVQIGSNQTISTINVGELETVQVNWTATYGSHNISVIIDPHDGIAESNEDNNVAYKPLLLKGDLNGDGDLTPADAAIALQIAVTGAHNDAADVSGDGRVTSLDALIILQAAAGAITL